MAGQKVLLGGNIITMDDTRARAEALIVQGDRVTFVGADQEARSRASLDAEVTELNGRTVIPGFNDNHLHSVSGGGHFARPHLYNLTAPQIIQTLAEWYPDPSPDTIITGFGWDYEACPEPHRALLDSHYPENPVILFQFSGHGLWVNGVTLEKMKINRDTPEPPGGEILKDAKGEPTGVLREMRHNPYLRKRYRRQFSDRERIDASLTRILQEYARLGITSVQDNTWFYPVVGRLRALEQKKQLTCRFSCWFFGEMPPHPFLMGFMRFDRSWYRRGLYKYFLDGTFSTRTAWMTTPYADAPDSTGKGKGADQILRFLLPRVRRRQQVGCHAIGDRAVKEFLDAVEIAQRRYPWTRDLRLRLEHAQVIREEDIPRLRDLGVLVAAQPHALGDPEKDRRLLGEERAQRAYPHRSLLDAGVGLSFGSDFPGEPTLDPLLAIHHVVNRDGPEAITAEEALRCYTRESAYAEFQEEEKGSLAAGKLADLVVLDADPLEVPPGKIKEINVLSTMVGGQMVYRADRGD
jgi:predicted amidohydrolase YtcJ